MRALACVIALAAAACGDPEIVVPDVLHVLTILPPHGSVGIDLQVEPVVYFSHEVKDAAAAAGAIGLSEVGAPPCSSGGTKTPVTATVAFESNQVAHLAPSAPLNATTCFIIEVAEGIEAADANVGAQPVTVRSLFETGT